MQDWGDDNSIDSDIYSSQDDSQSDQDNDELDGGAPGASSGGGVGGDGDVKKKKNYFIDESGSEEEEQRYIRSASEKRNQEMKKYIVKLQAAMKNDDWGAVESEWEALCKCVAKARNALEQVYPKFFVAFLVELDNKINDTLADKEGLKTMKPKKAHFFYRVKGHFKKYLKDDKTTEDKIALYRQDPEGFPDEGDEKKPKKMGADTDSDSDDNNKTGGGKQGGAGTGGAGAGTGAGGKPVEDLKEEEWTQEKIDKKLKQLLKERGTKTYVTGEVHEHIKMFSFLLPKVIGLARQLSIRFYVINALFDTNQGTSHLSVNTWKRIYNEVVIILETLFENAGFRLLEGRELEEETPEVLETTVYGHLLFSIEKLHDEYHRSLQNIDPHTPEFASRLTHERHVLLLLQAATKYYQSQVSPPDYHALAALACRQLDYLYYKREAVGGGIEEAALVEIGDEDVEEVEPEVVEPPAELENEAEVEKEVKEVEKDIDLLTPKNVAMHPNLREIMQTLTTLVYSHSPDDHHRRRVMLQHVYHLALHDQYLQARDMLLMTHLHEKIHHARITDQVMFNRAMVQLGLAGFRMGRVDDANNCLQDIIQNGKDKAKELLAQGITRYQGEKNADQEKQERSRQIPYHMHINLDLIECVLLVSGMLLEIPNIAQYRYRESKRKMISKYFRKSYDFYNDRQLFTGPPESTKESVIVAAKSLERGDWKTAQDIISGLEVWKLIPLQQTVLPIIKRQIQEQALRTYLFSYAQFYESIHISLLASMFGLEENVTHALVSNMIMNTELQASFDQPSGALIVSCPDTSPLQHLALNFAEKANFLLETNEQNEQRGVYERRWVDQGRGGGGGGGAGGGGGHQKSSMGQRGGRTYNQYGGGGGGGGRHNQNREQFTTRKKQVRVGPGNKN